MIKRIFTVFAMILCFALVSCTPTGSSFSPTITPIQRLPLSVATVTPMVSTVLAPTPTQAIQIHETCPNAVDSSAFIAVDGKFVLSPTNVNENPYLFDFASKSKAILPYAEGHYIDGLKISPDGQWMAYFISSKNGLITDSQLIVADTNGDIVYQKNVNRLKEWYAIDTWLDNQTLMLERYITLPNSATLATPLPVTLLNPFTGSVRDMDFIFPGLVYLVPKVIWDSYGYSATAYNPELNLVAYARVNSDAQETIVLWSLQSNTEVANIQAAIGFGSGPVWSPDGSQFIVDSLAKIPASRNWTEDERLSEELFSVDETGKVTRLTYLTELFKEVSINGYAWSSDGSQIAFNVLAKPDVKSSDLLSGSRLAIFNLKTKQVTLYCIHPYAESTRLFWSSNGQYLLLGAVNAEINEETKGTITYDSILLDINQNLLIKIADETIPLGWVLEKP